jgi:exodeoxyribonuclease VII large subunit
MTNFDLIAATERDILSVSQLNRKAKQLLETHLPLLWVEGELSNVSQPSSGHWYFTLKDDQAQVRCAMFRNRNLLVRLKPLQGQHVLLRARVSLYEGRGDYQLIAEHMEEAGTGALQRAFDELKIKLASEGLFDEALKKSLPSLPKHIAVITSSTGAAVRDILSVLARRFPAIPVSVLPVPVQGKEAAPQIVKAIELANRAGIFDVIVVARGGGSLEDLWPFNEEIVARAIHHSVLPIVSAVGHETDFTIADLVADLRAPTPSAAAELITPDGEAWLENFIGLEILLEDAMERRLTNARQKLEWLRARLRHPGERLQQQAQRLDGLEIRLQRAFKHELRDLQRRLQSLVLRQKLLQPSQRLQQLNRQVTQHLKQLRDCTQQQLQMRKQRLSETVRVLQTVSPLKTLERGYSITTRESGAVIHTSAEVNVGDSLQTRLAHGELLCRVEKIIS